jgi:hypothetical protein
MIGLEPVMQRRNRSHRHLLEPFGGDHRPPRRRRAGRAAAAVPV